MKTSAEDRIIRQQERYEQRSWSARIRSVGEFAIGAALVYSGTKHGTPEWKAFDGGVGAIGIVLGLLETHTALDTSRKAAALEGVLAQHQLTTEDIPPQLPERTESGISSQ